MDKSPRRIVHSAYTRYSNVANMSKAQVLHDLENKPQPFQSYKRLAVVGDIIFKLALLEDWYPAVAPKAKTCPCSGD